VFKPAADWERITHKEQAMLKIGWAHRDFTPDRPALVQGQEHTRIGRKAMDPLTLTAMAIEGMEGKEHAIVISCDLAMVGDDLMRSVRERLAKRLPAVAPDKVTMCATHTHTSLVIEDGWYPHPGGDVMTAAEGMARVAQSAEDAAAEAWAQRAPQSVRNAFGHAVIGHNRRPAYADGSAKMYGNTNQPDFVWIEGYEDHSLDMLFAWDADGRLTGILLVIPCPSQVDESLDVWSADYWHEVRQELRNRFGQHLQILGLCAAAGDQSPHFVLYGREEEAMRRRRGISERREIAQRVGDAVARALVCTAPVEGKTAFTHLTERMALTTRRVTPQDRAWAKAEYEKLATRDPKGWFCQRLRAILEADDAKPPKPYIAEVHALRIGEIMLATNPFELFLDYGLQIKARSPAAQTFVVQLASSTGLYLPTERAMQSSGYGGSLLVAPVGAEGGRELVEGTLRMLDQLK
jgi:hypothetical protein